VTARWRKSSHSGHAGENCVEIALSMDRNTRSGSTGPRQKCEKAGEKGSPVWTRSWTVSRP
jgi:hypothetical protein